MTLSAAAPTGGSAVTISDNSSALTTPSSVTVAAGASTATFTATAGSVTANQSVTVTAALNGSPATVAVTITAAPTCPCSIWTSNTIPGSVDPGDGQAVELGVRFRSDMNGYITGLRFYKSVANTGTHVGNLWSNSGTLLATVKFTTESASGWQQVTLSSPVAITAGNTYVGSYFAPAGHYSFDANYFAKSGMDHAPLHALADNADGRNGIYIYSSKSRFPSNTYLAANYWVDVVFSATTSSTATGSVSAAMPSTLSPQSVPASSQTSRAVSALSCSPRSVTAGSEATCDLSAR